MYEKNSTTLYKIVSKYLGIILTEWKYVTTLMRKLRYSKSKVIVCIRIYMYLIYVYIYILTHTCIRTGMQFRGLIHKYDQGFLLALCSRPRGLCGTILGSSY